MANKKKDPALIQSKRFNATFTESEYNLIKEAIAIVQRDIPRYNDNDFIVNAALKEAKRIISAQPGGNSEGHNG